MLARGPCTSHLVRRVRRKIRACAWYLVCQRGLGGDEERKPRQDMMHCRASSSTYLYTTTTHVIWKYLARTGIPGISYVERITLSRTLHLSNCLSGTICCDGIPRRQGVQQLRTCPTKPAISARIHSTIAIFSPLDDGQSFSSLHWQPRSDSKRGTWYWLLSREARARQGAGRVHRGLSLDMLATCKRYFIEMHPACSTQRISDRSNLC